MFIHKLYCLFFILIQVAQIQTQSGPDPWNYDSKPPELRDEVSIPPDLRLPLKRKLQSENKLGIGEWFFRRILTIVLKGGQTKIDEDGNVDISLQMRFDPKQWEILDASVKSDNPLTEDMLRRTVGYVQESIYKPSIVEQISMAWSDHIGVYLTEYKTHITWTLSFLAAAGGLLWLWSHMSHKHVIIIVFIFFYGYEVFISYKEAEQKELDMFLAAVERCKWLFWKSTCEAPRPDPIVFFKHMNPMKIGIRMFTTALAEPILAITGCIEVMLHGVTGGLWYPFDKIAYGILTVVINISLIYFLIMVIFNWLLNIPFHLGFGLFGISIRQRQRNLFSDNNVTSNEPRVQETDRISQATLDRILNVCSLALSSNVQNRNNVMPILSQPQPSKTNIPSIRRSASTGRLPNMKSLENNMAVSDNVFSRRRPHDGSGDAN